jgi:hypothetical protein
MRYPKRKTRTADVLYIIGGIAILLASGGMAFAVVIITLPPQCRDIGANWIQYTPQCKAAIRGTPVVNPTK